MIKLEISNKDDRKTVAAILIDNGYTVCIKREKVGKSTTTKTYIIAYKEEVQK